MTTSELLELFADELKERPELRAFIEDDDEDLEPAKERWRDCQHRSRLALRARGVELHHRIRGRNGLSTTALAIDIEKGER
jgi:hypothetical protein